VDLSFDVGLDGHEVVALPGLLLLTLLLHHDHLLAR
jgi:hypothetical protein